MYLECTEKLLVRGSIHQQHTEQIITIFPKTCLGIERALYSSIPGTSPTSHTTQREDVLTVFG